MWILILRNIFPLKLKIKKTIMVEPVRDFYEILESQGLLFYFFSTNFSFILQNWCLSD